MREVALAHLQLERLAHARQRHRQEPVAVDEAPAHALQLQDARRRARQRLELRHHAVLQQPAQDELHVVAAAVVADERAAVELLLAEHVRAERVQAVVVVGLAAVVVLQVHEDHAVPARHLAVLPRLRQLHALEVEEPVVLHVALLQLVGHDAEAAVLLLVALREVGVAVAADQQRAAPDQVPRPDARAALLREVHVHVAHAGDEARRPLLPAQAHELLLHHGQRRLGVGAARVRPVAARPPLAPL